MDKSGRLEMLVRVVDHGSLAAASRSLGLTPSAVSRGLAELEQSLGVTLLNRSTRRLQLSQDGQLVYERAQDILSRLRELESSVAKSAQKLSGTLRVGIPVPIGRYILWPKLSAFLNQYPDIYLDCKPIQDPSAMQSENFDLMLVTGEPPPSRLIARLLARGRPAIYAAPDYLRRFGEPKSPADLARHRCLVFHGPWMQTPGQEWHFNRDGLASLVRVKSRVVTSDREGLIVAALGGAGIIRMACFDPGLVESGRLRRLLPEWECTDGFNIYALHRRGAGVAPRIKAFLDFTRESFRGFDPEQVTLSRT